MPLLGQASGGWTESSSQLRLLNVNVRNSIGVLTDDSFTQANPSCVTTAGTISTRVDQTKTGVLSGSVAFVRPDGGSNYIGGAGSDATQILLTANFAWARGFRALGVFINSANGNAYENTPGVASGVGPYISSMGTCASGLYETDILLSPGGNPTTGNTITYYPGAQLVPSMNGFLMPKFNYNNAGTAFVNCDVFATPNCAESRVQAADNTATIIGIVKMVPDSVQAEVVFDQRI